MILRGAALSSRLLRPYSLRTIRHVSSAPPLIRIRDGTFYENYPTADDSSKGTNPPLFPSLNFVLPSKPGSKKSESLQHWAVIGTSGRTNLLDILRGQFISIPPNARSFPYLLTDEIAAKDPRLRFAGNAIQYIGFKGEGSEAIGGTRGAYLSARYESHREETDWTVRQYLKGQTSLNPMEGEEDGTVRDTELLERVITDLRMDKLLDMPVANLSNGQTRRARIAKALLKEPELLLLDEPFMGLDPATVRSISGLLERLAVKSNPRLILALRPQDTLPEWITHIVLLGNNNQIVFQGKRSEADKVLKVWKHLGEKKVPDLPAKSKEIYDKGKQYIESGVMDRQLLWDLSLINTKTSKISYPPPRGGDPIIEMNGVHVKYGEKSVLGDWQQSINGEKKDGLYWKVRRGQRWAILGSNGSGKTTLLSLITSDHPQAYALPVKILGRSRLPEKGKPGISIFELQSRMGHSSPEIHAFFPRQLTIRQSVESAFAETFLSKPTLDPERDQDVSAVLRWFRNELDPNAREKAPNIEPSNSFPKLSTIAHLTPFPQPDYHIDYADTIKFGELNVAQQRVVLFIRALVHKPDIIILDEAFSGMPASFRDKCIYYLEAGEANHRGSGNKMLTRRTTPQSRNWEKYPLATARFSGLSDDQALIMISHVKEEFPDSVRHYMRLPSDQGDGSEPIDFRFGTLKSESVLADPQVWNAVWGPGENFRKRRFLGSKEESEDDDGEVYEYQSV